MYIPTGQLFADWQTSMTEMYLFDMLTDPTPEQIARRGKNHDITEVIDILMRERFSQGEIENFLENGYPRRVEL